MPRDDAAVFLLLALIAGASRAGATIYRCEIDGVVSFSDTPCGAASSIYEPDVTRVSGYEPPPAGKIEQPRRPASRRTPLRSNGDDLEKRAAQCARIDASLRELRAKMRAGYRAKEGERLKERQAKLRARRREQRCR